MMKTITTVIRILLGLMFTVFGLNGFLHFIPMQPMPQPAIDFFGRVSCYRLKSSIDLLRPTSRWCALAYWSCGTAWAGCPLQSSLTFCFFICFWPPADWQSHL